MKLLVVYASKTGFVYQYAKWLVEELGGDLLPAASADLARLEQYDTIIYGGGLYAVGINGIKLITENFTQLKGKNLLVFACGVTPPRPEVLQEIKEKNFTPEQRENIAFFYLRGGFNFAKLSILDKMLMQTLRGVILIKKWRGKTLSSDEQGILTIFKQPLDYTRRENLQELLAYVRSYGKA